LDCWSSLTIQSALLSEEADLTFRVAPDETHDDGLLLAALESVNAAQLDPRERLF
jgi:hypothetical protein